MRSVRRSTAIKLVRRSFALPGRLIDEAIAVADNELKHNLNKLVTVALQEYVETHKRKEFERAMAQMGNDPQVLTACGAIQQDFEGTELDGLSNKRD
jgi:hypothetical protein